MLAYWAERLRLRLAVPVVALLTLAARAGAGALSTAGVATDASVLFLLFAQFRLWDDLANRAHDRVRHPNRTLVRAASVWPFQAIAWLMAAVNAAVIARTYPGRLPIELFLAISLAALGWYSRRTGRSVAGDHLVLLKYPVFVAIVALGRRAGPLALVMCWALAAYAAACLYEALHDPASPARRHAALVAAEGVLFLSASSAGIVLGVHS